jgi:hypothetical protein
MILENDCSVIVFLTYLIVVFLYEWKKIKWLKIRDILLWLFPQLILLLKWKHNNINKREGRKRTNGWCARKQILAGYHRSLAWFILLLLHRRRRHSTCGAVSCPNSLIHLCASYVSHIRNIFSLPLSPLL